MSRCVPQFDVVGILDSAHRMLYFTAVSTRLNKTNLRQLDVLVGERNFEAMSKVIPGTTESPKVSTSCNKYQSRT